MTWIHCPCCENFWCVLHNQHAHDCPCPPVEEWPESPYVASLPIGEDSEDSDDE